MNNKKRISIKLVILAPVFLLGLFSIGSNINSIVDFKSVNNSATEITDIYMTSIEELASIENVARNIHMLSLSHIVATDFDTMIDIVENIKEQELVLDGKLNDFEEFVNDDTRSSYNDLRANYEEMKHALVFLLGYSANMQTSQAYACANGDVSKYATALIDDLEKIILINEREANESKEKLDSDFSKALARGGINVIVCLAALIITVLLVVRRITSPITVSQKEIVDILEGIEKHEGDLTKRITLKYNDEIGDLENGINNFLSRLQAIMKVMIDNCSKMEVVVNEVQSNVRISNDSVSDLSAVTEELSATMTEVGNSVSRINTNAESVREEVEEIANKSSEINDYSKNMKTHADEMENSARSKMTETGSKVNEMLSVLNKAIEDSKSVDQVNSLTNDILSISSKTNLLALNASIEAARAGEAGKGFAVVADEIRQLADSSREAANRIQDINVIVIDAVHNLAENANTLIDYMNDSILPEFENFVQSGEQYRENASYVEKVMNEFTKKTDELKDTMDEMASSINTITSAIEEGARGVNGAAQSTQGLVEEMEHITLRMDENQSIANDLLQETKVFTKI